MGPSGGQEANKHFTGSISGNPPEMGTYPTSQVRTGMQRVGFLITGSGWRSWDLAT